MDRNSFIGLLLISGILIAWMFYSSPSKEELAREKRYADSIELAQKKNVPVAPSSPKKPLPDSLTSLSDSARAVLKQQVYGPFAAASEGKNEYITIENELIKAQISTLGGRIASVQLKNYKTHQGKPLFLFTPDSSRFTLAFSANSRGFSTDSLYFVPEGNSFAVSGNDSGSVSLRLYAGDKGKYLEYVYTLRGNSYLVDVSLNTVGMHDVIASNASALSLKWWIKTPTQEKSIANERAASTVYYKYAEDEVDNISETSEEAVTLDAKLKWVALKQQFFTSVLIAGDAFGKPGDVSSYSSTGSASYVKDLSARLSIPYGHKVNESFDMSFYFGPLHYKTLKQFDLSLEEQIPLGWGIFGWVNKFIVIPIFNFLNSFNLNFGIIILILTIIIKIILFPIAYKTYLSSAKMRVLKPEIDEINKKFGNEDPLKKQQAIMTLYRKAGVNPLAGCVPLLLQLPILIALFRFFPSSIELRQERFLWADDLSSYDSILDLSFNIPFYGDHVSLFTLLMTASTILYTYTNSQLMGTNDQMPQMKWMMYLMPIIFLGVFNNYSAGLSYYYFLANIITYGQQKLMQRFVDEDEIHRKIQENKKKPVKMSKFQQRLEEMAKQQRQIQEAKKRK